MEQTNLFKLGIQFFASENDDDVKTDDFDNDYEDEEVDNEEDAEEVENEDEEFSDDEETEEDETEQEDEEVEEETVEKKNDGKKKQTRVEDSKFAQMRKEQEKLKNEQQKAREEGRIEGIKQAFNNTNKFTGKKLTDKHSVETFLTMLEMEEKGLDPIEDYADYIEEKSRKVDESNKVKQQQDEFFKKDYEDFVKMYPDVSLEELANNEDFELFSEGKLGHVPLAKIYESFLKFQSKYNKKIDQEARKKIAKSKSSPGSTKSDDSDNGKYYTLEQLSKMSDKEIEANWEKVEKSYDRLQKKNKK